MFRIHTEVPSGAESRGYDYSKPEDAFDSFARIVHQLTEMNFVGELIMTEDGVEVTREIFRAS